MQGYAADAPQAVHLENSQGADVLTAQQLLFSWHMQGLMTISYMDFGLRLQGGVYSTPVFLVTRSKKQMIQEKACLLNCRQLFLCHFSHRSQHSF